MVIRFWQEGRVNKVAQTLAQRDRWELRTTVGMRWLCGRNAQKILRKQIKKANQNNKSNQKLKINHTIGASFSIDYLLLSPLTGDKASPLQELLAEVYEMSLIFLQRTLDRLVGKHSNFERFQAASSKRLMFSILNFESSISTSYPTTPKLWATRSCPKLCSCWKLLKTFPKSVSSWNSQNLNSNRSKVAFQFETFKSKFSFEIR